MKRYNFPHGIVRRLVMYWRAVALVLAAVLLGAANSCSAASLFLSWSTDNMLFRYDVEPTGTPTLSATIVPPAPTGIEFGPTGELFVANYLTSGTVSRFLDPLGTPAANGIISGLNHPEEMLFRRERGWR